MHIIISFKLGGCMTITGINNTQVKQAPSRSWVNSRLSSRVDEIFKRVSSSRLVQWPIRAGKSTVTHFDRNKFRYAALAGSLAAGYFANRSGLCNEPVSELIKGVIIFLKHIRVKYFHPGHAHMINGFLPERTNISAGSPIEGLANKLLEKGLQGLDSAFSNQDSYAQEAIKKAFQYLIDHELIGKYLEKFPQEIETACKVAPFLQQCPISLSDPLTVAKIATTAFNSAFSSMNTTLSTTIKVVAIVAQTAMPYAAVAAPYAAAGVAVYLAYRHFSSSPATPPPQMEAALANPTHPKEKEASTSEYLTPRRANRRNQVSAQKASRSAGKPPLKARTTSQIRTQPSRAAKKSRR